MRASYQVIIAMGLLATAAATAATSCSLVARHHACDVDPDCELTGAGGGGGTGGGHVNPACTPSDSAWDASTECGVFVSSSIGDDAGGDGTPEAPVRTLSKALDLAVKAGKPVYACAEEFSGPVDIAGASVYGGLLCTSGWAYGGGAKTTLSGPADTIALRVLTSEVGARLEDVTVRVPDAMVPGGSSIAALVEEGASVELVRCELEAGRGANGAMGETPADSVGPEDPNDPAIKGSNGAAACGGNMMTGNPGGSGTTNALCMSSVGGIGGTGREANGEDGTDGQPVGAFGLHGVGQPAMGSWICGAVGNGQGGDNGIDGAPGASAQGATSLGTLSAMGLSGGDGEAGQTGTPGQGGGGGGGAKGKAGCNGASGGGGGAGGCGGKGGLGGQAGGSSIALVSLGATLSFTEVKLRVADGGSGGDGGNGQNGAIGGFGGAGGPGASGTFPGCSGGQGGVGGFGGKGGGGRGGHSLGIAYRGEAPSMDGITVVVEMPGNGGAGEGAAGQGDDGVAVEAQAFP